jgi:hypothetical protein
MDAGSGPKAGCRTWLPRTSEGRCHSRSDCYRQDSLTSRSPAERGSRQGTYLSADAGLLCAMSHAAGLGQFATCRSRTTRTEKASDEAARRRRRGPERGKQQTRAHKKKSRRWNLMTSFMRPTRPVDRPARLRWPHELNGQQFGHRFKKKGENPRVLAFLRVKTGSLKFQSECCLSGPVASAFG